MYNIVFYYEKKLNNKNVPQKVFRNFLLPIVFKTGIYRRRVGKRRLVTKRHEGKKIEMEYDSWKNIG